MTYVRGIASFAALCLCFVGALGCLGNGESATAVDSAGLTELFGETLLTSSKEAVEVGDMTDGKVAIYFSAQWCPPCRQFTPLLVNAYNELRDQGKSFQVVFVSSDQDEESMWKYMRDYKMPWYALPFGDERGGQLNDRFAVRGIPRLVVVDGNGQVLSDDARGDIMTKGSAAWDSW